LNLLNARHPLLAQGEAIDTKFHTTDAFAAKVFGMKDGSELEG
jgi:hypothetical protein